jgi:hypothetical protein
MKFRGPQALRDIHRFVMYATSWQLGWNVLLPRERHCLDFSMDYDFADVPNARERLFRALRDRFDAEGLKVFDEQMEPKPQLKGEDTKPWWGGYELRFKLIEHPKGTT